MSALVEVRELKSEMCKAPAKSPSLVLLNVAVTLYNICICWDINYSSVLCIMTRPGTSLLEGSRLHVLFLKKVNYFNEVTRQWRIGRLWLLCSTACGKQFTASVSSIT